MSEEDKDNPEEKGREDIGPDSHNADGGPLGIIRRGLYARKEPEDLKRRQERLSKLGVTNRAKNKVEKKEDTLAVTKYRNLTWQRAKRMARVFRFSGVLFLTLIVLIWVGVLTVWYRSSVTVTEDQAMINLEGPQEFTAGEEIVYKLSFENDSRVDWHDVEVVFSGPRGFNYRSSGVELEEVGNQLVHKVGNLGSGETGEIEIKGQLIGEQNETAVASAELILTPENFPSGRFSTTSLLATTITALSLDVAIAIPNDAASGERVVATLNVVNLSNQDLEGVYVRLKPAPGAQLLVGDSDFSPGFSQAIGEWKFESLASLETRELKFVFAVAGQPGEQRVIDLESGIQQGDDRFVQRQITQVVQVSASEVAVKQTYNNVSGPLVVRAGEEVSGVIEYSNIGTVGLKDVIVKVGFEGLGFDSSSLILTSGAYDSATETITWTAATVPELSLVQPQQSGKIPFSFTVLETDEFPTQVEIGKNNVILSTATVDSPDLPAPPGQAREVVSDSAVLSVRTDAILETDAFYDDGRLGIKSSGPLPPKVGETTTYTVRLRAGSTLNDISDVVISAVAPDGVSFTGQKFVTGGEVELNDRTGEITWRFPQITGMTGRSIPSQDLYVQVAVTPGDNVRGNNLKLLNKASIQFKDQFTDEDVTFNASDLPTTETASPNKGQVE